MYVCAALVMCLVAAEARRGCHNVPELELQTAVSSGLQELNPGLL